MQQRPDGIERFSHRSELRRTFAAYGDKDRLHGKDEFKLKWLNLSKDRGEEWSGRGDSNPRLQLGKLPYYPYTTAAFRRKIYNTLPGMPQGGAMQSWKPVVGRCRLDLADLNHTSGFHHRGSLLPPRKAGGLGTVGINAREPLPIRIVDRHLPVAVLATPVFP